jgi:3D (Asp-Asp-Asp) domain-containing protein
MATDKVISLSGKTLVRREIKTTTTQDSNDPKVVEIASYRYACELRLEQNAFGDTLPIIPEAARVERDKVLYQLKIKARLTQQDSGAPVPNFKFSIKSNRSADRVESKGKTNQQGEVTFTLTTRESGEVELEAATAGITMQRFHTKLQDAWYEAPFLITGYNVCDENDFSGELVMAKGLDEKHKDDFLYGAAGIAMQGTGKATTGQYIRLNNSPGGWKKNTKGHPERLENPSAAEFGYADTVQGKYGEVKENCSIAVDKTIIPPKAKVKIEGVGERSADDAGGAIKLYHIDNFLGAGKLVVKAWLSGGVNRTKRRVKYLGANR